MVGTAVGIGEFPQGRSGCSKDSEKLKQCPSLQRWLRPSWEASSLAEVTLHSTNIS
jgi:hypothetical protein